MRYHNIATNDMRNGDGLRTVLWVAGCNHHCINCHNPITWDPNGGIPFDDDAEEELLSKLSEKHISGITFSGGDPLHENNIKEIARLCKIVKERFPTKTIWLYTGSTWEDIIDEINTWHQDELILSQIIKNIDILVDGEFIEKLKDVNYHWAGSTNQRVINVPESLKEGKVVIHE